MAGGTLRGAAAGAGVLIVLQAFTTARGADAVGGLLGTINGLVTRALDPSVPAIPDHSKSPDPTTSDPRNMPVPVTPPGQAPATGPGSPLDSNPHWNSNGDLVPGNPNGVPGGTYDPGIHPYSTVYRIPGITA